MHKLLRIFSSRLFLIVTLVIAQFVWFLLYFLNFAYVNDLFLATQIIGMLLAVYEMNQHTDPAFKIGWIFLLCSVPVIGVPTYLLFGNKKLPKKLNFGTLAASAKLEELLQQDQKEEVLQNLKETDVYPVFNYGWHQTRFPVYQNTRTTYYPSGEAWFPVYLEKLKAAKHFIFIEMFIIDRGYVWDEIFAILKQKVQEGVEVKLIYDDFGCVTMPTHFHRHLRECGIEAYAFNKLRPALIVQMNNRDHRKITVIDNRIGFTGGVNLADEYINRIKRFGYWKDSAIMVEGPAVWSMSAQFLGMYHYMAKNSNDTDYRGYHLPAASFAAEGFVQPFADSPTDGEYTGMIEHLNLIHQAKKYIYINTPYLILNDVIFSGLTIAAKKGIDVRILVPHHPDKWLVFQATKHNYSRLLQAGVKIYEFTPGFNHSKAIVVDDELGLVGSINTDYRSYFLHFEDGILLYRTSAVKQIRQDFEESLQQSKEISLEEMEHTNLFVRIFRGLLQVLMTLA